MAEGVFTISADIVPVLDERQLESQAQTLVKKFNSLLAKDIKPLQISANTKSLEQASTFSSRIISQLTVMEQGTSGVNKALTTTANVFDLATKNAVGLVQRGVRPILDGFQQIAPVAARTFQIISSVGGAAFNTVRAGALQLGNAFNITNTNILGYAGNIRKAIQENTRFKDGLDFIKRSGDSLKSLPQTFANVQAQVIAGVSPLQRAAQAGSGMARSLAPFLVVGVAVARQLSAVSQTIETLTHDIGALVSSLVPLQARSKAALDGFDNPKAAAAIENLKKSVPEVAGGIDKILLSTRGQGIDPFIGKFKDLRDEFVQTELRGTGVVGMLKRLFAGQFAAQTDKAKADLKELNKTLIELGAPKDVPFFKRMVIEAENAAAKIKNVFGKAVTAISPSARNIVFTAALEVSKASQTAKETGRNLAADFKKGFTEGSEKAGGGVKGTIAGLFGGLGNLGGAESEAGKLGTGIFSKFFDAFKKSSDTAGGGGGGILSKVLGGAEGAESKLGSLKNAFSALAGSAGGFGEALGPLLGAGGLVGIAGAAINAAAHLETLKVALKGVFGPEAESGLAKIQAFANVTPFTLETATNAVIKLGASFKGLTIPAGLAITQQFAGAAAAIGASDDAINRAILGFTQMQAAGKVGAQDLRQITEALPNVSQVAVYGQIAKQLNVTNAQAKKLASEGLVDVTTGSKAILQALHDVPGAAGALEKQSKTFNGLLSTAKDTVTQFLGALGGPLLAVAKPVLQLLIGYFGLLNRGIAAIRELVKGLPESFSNIADRFSFIKTALAKVAELIDFVKEHIQELIDKVESIPGLKRAIDLLGSAFSSAGDKGKQAGTDIKDGLQEALAAMDPVQRALAAVVNASNPADIIKNFNDLGDAQKEAHDHLVSSDIDILKKTLAVQSAFEARDAATKAVTTATQALTDAQAKHDKEISDQGIKLEKDLTDARAATADATDKQTLAQTNLAQALAGASAEDSEKADIALAQAKLRLRQIIEDEKKAQDALNATQSTSIDLTGLSVDQVKSRLKVARAALDAQKELEKKAGEKKTPEQQSIDDSTKAITKRQAELDVVDALKAQNDLKIKGTEADPAVIAARIAVRDATKATTDAKQKELDIQKDLDKLKAPDLAWQKEKANLQEAITASQKAQTKAAQDAQLAVLEAKNDQDGILKLLEGQINRQPELKRLLGESNVPLINANSLGKDLGIKFDENKTKVEAVKSEVDLVNEALQKSIDLAKQFGLNQLADSLALEREILRVGQDTSHQNNPKAVGALIGAGFKDEVNQFLRQPGAAKGVNELISSLIDKNFHGDLNDPTFKKFQQQITDVAVLAATRALSTGEKDQGQINEAIKLALQTIPGIGPLKFAQGGVVDQATAGIFGEAGREAILPLTRPMRMADIIGHPQVLPPVLAALDRITLPSKAEPIADLSGIRMVRSSPQIPVHHEQAKRDEALAKAIVAEMKEAGMSMGQTIVNNEFVAPDGNDPLAKIKANQIAREIKRQIENL